MSNLHEQDNLQGTPLLFHQNLSTANEFDDSGVIDIPNSSVDRAKGIFLQLQSRESPHFYIAAGYVSGYDPGLITDKQKTVSSSTHYIIFNDMKTRGHSLTLSNQRKKSGNWFMTGSGNGII